MNASRNDLWRVKASSYRYDSSSQLCSVEFSRGYVDRPLVSPVGPLSFGVVLLGNARLAERVETCEGLRSRVDVEADLADEKLVVDLFHQFLAGRHGGSGCRERAQRPDLRQSSSRTRPSPIEYAELQKAKTDQLNTPCPCSPMVKPLGRHVQ